MPLDPVALAAAASFTVGCAGIHALRRHADVLTLVLGVLAYGLATLVGALLAGRSGLPGLPDPVPAWAFATTAGL
ncbi:MULTISPECIES: hypothetical protein [Methylobacterium]|jgi:hypothetical protein|uniref:Uncharacterized protein n=3 Tax=Methylobacterium TaxID=407 RepID=A0AAE8L8T6_9HYPH|nr:MULTISPECIES: hypothetical protein [Methylobacterium]KOX48885.1 hypothetical protein ADL19_21030 [Streptomyces purpurogeneiscleroticus]AIQ92340.1 protein of unassigned function [Methylobacterium oryzae CBMB20]APT32791.1 hypothetical protein MCBMB27_03500 [Methylobacterium phyllosphaerae]AWV16022.1 hypothetical protein A3862_11335 [Methylobacterium sp. XJLW]MBA9064848.1 hypothetical protein [Methylobacterium fujisawaense]